MYKKICTHCGAANSDDSLYCWSCQHNIEGHQTVPEQCVVGTDDCKEEIISIFNWIVIFIGLTIPIVNILEVFILAYGSEEETLRNFGKAVLIMTGIVLLVLILMLWL